MWNPFRKKPACSYCGGKLPKTGHRFFSRGRQFCSLDCTIKDYMLTEIEKEAGIAT